MTTTRRPAIESVGQRFGMLVVTGVDEGGGRARAKALCDCGSEWAGRLNALRTGNTTSCGCQTIKFEDHTGERFGRWVAVECITRSASGVQGTWRCICDCGKQGVVQSGALKNGFSRSCGCLSVEKTRDRAKTHGMSHSEVWSIWNGIKGRCYNKNNKDYHNYGGRGIAMADEWVNDFAAFFAYIGERPSKDHTVERSDNNSGYVPGNVSWQTRFVQANNNRGNRLITIDGVTKTMNQWCQVYDVYYWTVSYRINISKWDHLRALTTPTTRPYTGSGRACQRNAEEVTA
jgi:hypothetical protein